MKGGHGETEDQASYFKQIHDVIGDTYAWCMDGGYAWAEGLSFPEYFCRAMRECFSVERRREKRQRDLTPPGDEEPAAPPSHRDDVISGWETIARIREAIRYAPQDVRDYFEACLRMGKRQDVAALLSWSAKRVKLTRAKLNRRLAAAHIHWSYDDE